jgi:hypothetical protein
VGHANEESVEFERFNLSRSLDLLRQGTNVLAIQGLNSEPTNVDFLLTPVLRAGKVVDRGISPAAVLYTSPFVVPPDAQIKARSLLRDQWSTLREANVPTVRLPLRVSELMFHPADATEAEQAAGFRDADTFEFIELTNTADFPIDLANVQLVQTRVGGQEEGVGFDFRRAAIQRLEPGQFVVIVEDLAAFEYRYGSQLPVAGQWSGGLSNDSEQITVMSGGQLLQQFRYNDSWNAAADGGGASLQIVDVTSSNLDRWSQPSGWRASSVPGGTPGRDDQLPTIAGDSNHDGIFNSSDIVAVFQAGEYEDLISGNSTFEEGDWNQDGDFTTSDLVFAFQRGSYEATVLRDTQVPSPRAARRGCSFWPQDGDHSGAHFFPW